MKKIIICFTFFCCLKLDAQNFDIEMRSGSHEVNVNTDVNYSVQDPYRLIFFDNLPSEEQKNEMNSLGIEFLYYLPDNIFVSFFTNEVDFESLLQYNVVSVK